MIGESFQGFECWSSKDLVFRGELYGEKWSKSGVNGAGKGEIRGQRS